MYRILLGILALSALTEISTALDCSTVPDGAYDRGCQSYTQCTHGVATVVDCPKGMVFNSKTGGCDNQTNVAPPCGRSVDCSVKPDGRYANVDENCKTWYTCQHKKFLGQNFCPEGTVFDEKLSTCNWPEAVPPPCGTLTGK